MKVAVAIVDLTAGMLATVAILGALYERVRSEQGQYIDISLLDSHVAWLANVGSNYLVSGQQPARFGNAHPNIVPYQTFATKDGWIAVGVGNDRQWKRLCKLANWADLETDDRFASNPARVEHRGVLVPILEERFKSRASQAWQADLVEAGIPCGPINTIDQVFSDPQVLARDMLVQIPHPTAGEVRLAGIPFKLSRTPAREMVAPPLLGQHTEEVLRDTLGMTPRQIEQLRAASVI